STSCDRRRGTRAMAMAIVLSASDGQATTEAVNGLLQGYNTPGAPPDVVINSGPLAQTPRVWDPVVVLYVLSPGSMADPTPTASATALGALRFPLVPVPLRPHSYPSHALREPLDLLPSGNSVDISCPAALNRLRQCLELNLGLGAKNEAHALSKSY